MEGLGLGYVAYYHGKRKTQGGGKRRNPKTDWYEPRKLERLKKMLNGIPETFWGKMYGF